MVLHQQQESHRHAHDAHGQGTEISNEEGELNATVSSLAISVDEWSKASQGEEGNRNGLKKQDTSNLTFVCRQRNKLIL